MADDTFILGTGIIGLSTAYYLSQAQPPSTIHLVEPSPTLFSSASGNAGGFLAADWFSPSVSALGKLSFDEHRRLADEHGGGALWGYSSSRGVSYTAALKGKAKKAGRGDDWLRQGTSRAEAVSVTAAASVDEPTPSWLKREEGDELESISDEGSTAQVDPLRLCQFLLKACLDRGVQLHQPARAISVEKDMHDELSSIKILNTETHATTDLPCTKILIAAGAWSPQVFSALFPFSRFKPPVTSLAGHSLVVRTPKWEKADDEIGTHAMFTTDDGGYSPELFSRRGGEIYIAGINTTTLSLPDLAADSYLQMDEKSINTLKATARRLLGVGEELQVVREALCFRPVTERGTPIVGRIAEEELGNMRTRGGEEGGVWLAAGHGPWGISMSLGTGKVMAELIRGIKPTVDVSGLGI